MMLAAAMLALAGTGPGKPETVRDRLWIWAHDARAYDGAYGLPGTTRWTPAQAAEHMGIRNVLFIQIGGKPAPPFDAYYAPFRRFDRVEWSLFDNNGRPHELGEAQEHIYRLAAREPNLTGFVMDDFLVVPEAKPPTAMLTAAQLTAVRRRIDDIAGRRMDLSVVVYAHQLDPRIAPLLESCDTVLFWTWKLADLAHLESNFRRLRQLLPGKRVLLGCYMWDFDAGKPIPMDLMRKQCDLGLRWLQSGRIEGMIFLATNICDLGIEAVEWTRQWIARVGERPLRR